jgi:hypothetical protein
MLKERTVGPTVEYQYCSITPALYFKEWYCRSLFKNLLEIFYFVNIQT